MKKQLFYFASILIIVASCQNKNHYEVTIQAIGGDEKIEKMYLFKQVGETVDSTESNNGIFKFSGVLEEPQFCVVYYEKSSNKAKSFVLDYGRTNIIMSSERFSESEISFTNSKNNELFTQFTQQIKTFEDQFYSYHLKSEAAKEKNDTSTFKLLQDSSSILTNEMQNFIIDFTNVNRNYNGLAIAVAEELVSRKYHTETLFDIYTLYPDNLKSSFYGSKLLEHLNSIDTPDWRLGNQFTNFTINDINGNAVSLVDYREKYVLIELWASWCKACRKENPNLIECYNMYKNNGFEIIGVSLDTDKEAWIRAIEKDQLNWINVSELKGWESELIKHYKIKGIPTNLLLDKSGKIVALNLKGEMLNKELEQIFNK